MRIPRLYTGQALSPGLEVQLEPEGFKHLHRVLRLRDGAPLRLFNGDGMEYPAVLMGGGARVASAVGPESAPILMLRLILGISKGERMDFAVQKAVELGVTRITPLFAGRSVVQLRGERLHRRMEHWRRVMISACEQSGRCRLPELDLPTGLTAVTAEGDGGDCRLVLDHRGKAGLDRLQAPRRGVDLLVGPEGGLEPEEIRLAIAGGFTPVKLGPRILRTETAPLASLAAIQMLWGDFRQA